MDRWCGNKKALQGVDEERYILHKMKRRKANWTGHIVHCYCLPNTALKERYDRWEDEEEDVSFHCYCIPKHGNEGKIKIDRKMRKKA